MLEESRGGDMKKALSVIVLVLCSFVSIVLIVLFGTLVMTLIEVIYASSRALFWIVVIFGGSFGLGLLWYLIPLAATISVSLSQKIDLSKRGTRFTVIGIIIIVLYGLNALAIIFNPNLSANRAVTILSYVLIVFFSIALIMHGRETAVAEYIPPEPKPTRTKNRINEDASDTNSRSSSTEIPVDSLKTLKELHDSGVISAEEFEKKKRQLLGL